MASPDSADLVNSLAPDLAARAQIPPELPADKSKLLSSAHDDASEKENAAKQLLAILTSFSSSSPRWLGWHMLRVSPSSSKADFD
jgi:hypothetical protein